MRAAWGSPPAPAFLSGAESIGGVDATVRDFWAWCSSDFRSNTARSRLAEYLVAVACGAADRPRVEWDSYDVRTPESLRIEVKSGAYLQSWQQARLSTVTFRGLTARTWSPVEGNGSSGPYNADAYVFAVQTAIDHAGYDALDLDQWSFWVLPRKVLASTGQRSIRLTRVQQLAGPSVSYAGLAGRVREVVTPAG